MNKNRIAIALPFSVLFSGVISAAQYELTEVPTQTQGPFAFANNIDAQGNVGVQVSDGSNQTETLFLYNLPIDTSLINFESENVIDSLTDPEAAQAGNFNADDLLFLTSSVAAAEDNVFSQQLSEVESFQFGNGNLDKIIGFDLFDSDLDSFTRSINTRVNGVNDTGVLVGLSESPYRKLPYTTEGGTDLTYVVNDFRHAGFVQLNGQTIRLTADDDLLGGISQAQDINNNLQVVGMMSINNTETLQTSAENCEDDEIRADLPVEACLQSLRGSMANFNAEFTTPKRSLVSGQTRVVAASWQLNADGEVISSETFGLLFEPEADDENFYTNAARAVNDAGVVVGHSHILVEDNGTRIRTHAAIYDNDQTTGFIDTEEFTSSTANDINNNNLVIGDAYGIINGSIRSKFFVYDYDSGELSSPDDFFPGSASFAAAINNNNLVVGNGEVESSLDGVRRREAFLYDHNAETFTNLNDLLSCESPYTLVEATAINDAGEIAATAVVAKARRNILGEIELDEQGSEIIEDTVVAVKLTPIPGGQIDDCSEQEAEERFERSAASSHFGILAGLLVLLGLRIRCRKPH